jgi:hypothetical protein
MERGRERDREIERERKSRRAELTRMRAMQRTDMKTSGTPHGSHPPPEPALGVHGI